MYCTYFVYFEYTASSVKTINHIYTLQYDNEHIHLVIKHIEEIEHLSFTEHIIVWLNTTLYLKDRTLSPYR